MVMGRGEGNRREKWREEGKSNRRVIITFCPCLFPFEGNYSLKEKSFSDGGVNEWEGLSFITICAYSWSFVTIHGYSWFLKIPNSCWLFVIICGTKLCQSLPLAKSNILYASYLCFDRNFHLQTNTCFDKALVSAWTYASAHFDKRSWRHFRSGVDLGW